MNDSQQCKLCGSDTEIVMEEPIYYHCPNCDFIFIDDEFIIDYEEEKGVYDQHENSLENEGYVNMFKDFIARAITPHKEDIRTALEFGSGPGPVLAHLLKEEGVKIIDIYDPYFAPEKIFHGKKYDLITSTEVFEHFSDPYKEIEMLKKHLDQNGIMAIMTLFHNYGSDDFDFSDWWYIRDKTHISFYSPRTFEWIADHFGLELIYHDEKRIVTMKIK